MAQMDLRTDVIRVAEDRVTECAGQGRRRVGSVETEVCGTPGNADGWSAWDWRQMERMGIETGGAHVDEDRRSSWGWRRVGCVKTERGTTRGDRDVWGES